MIDTRDGIIGLAIGDAMGVPLEGMDRKILLNEPVTQMMGNLAHNVPVGAFSDDTSMTLATIDAIVQKGKIDTKDIFKQEHEQDDANDVYDTPAIKRKIAQ